MKSYNIIFLIQVTAVIVPGINIEVSRGSFEYKEKKYKESRGTKEEAWTRIASCEKRRDKDEGHVHIAHRDKWKKQL